MSNMSFAEAAYQVLKQAGKPISVNEITSLVLERGMISTRGKTPSATMGARLYVDTNNKGEKSRFVKVNRGKLYFNFGS